MYVRTYPLRAARSLLALLLLSCFLSLHAQAPAPAPERALPLKRFEVSKRATVGPWFEPAIAIGDDYFDGRDSRARVRRHLQVARSVGAKYLRCAFSWNGIEPEDGKYNFAFWDMLVEEAEKAGVRVIPYVAYTPEWAARSKNEFWKQPPRDPALFARVMRVLAARYRGRIKSWELWNEPDLQEYWQGTPAEFAELIKAGAVAVREGDPDAVIVLGGMSHGPGQFFDELMRVHRIDRWVDVIAMHAYSESWDEERAESVFHEHIPKMDSYALRVGDPVDLWLDEMGYADYRYSRAYASAYNTSIQYAYEHTSRYQAEFLFKSFVMTLAAGDVSLAGWYRIDDFRNNDKRMPADKVHYHLGIVDVNGKPKPAFYAMRFMSKLLEYPSRVADRDAPVKAQANSQAVVHVFERRDGKVIVTAWLRSSEPNDVPQHTGMEIDRRREQVDIGLPCTASSVRTYNALGRALTTLVKRRREIAGVTLRGDRVFVAEATCEVR